MPESTKQMVAMRTNNKLRETLVSVKKSIDEMGAASLDGDPEILLMSLTQVCARLSARIDTALAESANAEKSSAVGDGENLLKTADLRFDICRDIEQVLKIGRDYQNKDGYRGAHYDTVKLLCDAIEYQQEQLNAKTEVGDCAKLREAAKKLLDALYDMGIDENTLAIAVESPNCQMKSEHTLSVLKEVRAALAAPPRNCDLYKTKEKAQEAFMEEACDHPCGNCWVEDINNECGVEWLLAPATEKKGGNDGNE